MKTCHIHDYQSPTFTNKPCPKCIIENAAKAAERHDLFAIHCNECGMSTGYFGDDCVQHEVTCINCGQTILAEKENRNGN